MKHKSPITVIILLITILTSPLTFAEIFSSRDTSVDNLAVPSAFDSEIREADLKCLALLEYTFRKGKAAFKKDIFQLSDNLSNTDLGVDLGHNDKEVVFGFSGWVYGEKLRDTVRRYTIDYYETYGEPYPSGGM
ncbi:MAG: hypothetical protein ABH883_03955, partial [Candidatus Omnitrophota bacterium]